MASARLCRVLNLDPSIRLHPTDAWVVPAPIVPDPIPLSELIALALLQRPEMGERRVVVREALLALHGARCLAVLADDLAWASAAAASAAAATWSGRSSAASAAGATSMRSPTGRSRTWASATSP